MSVLFGLYQPEEGEIHKDGKKVEINDPNDANDLGIGMVHQHFKLVECFSVLDNIILGVETTKGGFLQKDVARKKVMALSEKYRLLFLHKMVRHPWFSMLRCRPVEKSCHYGKATGAPARAMKGLDATVNMLLTAIKDGKWGDYVGKIENLGMCCRSR